MKKGEWMVWRGADEEEGGDDLWRGADEVGVGDVMERGRYSSGRGWC